MLDVRVKAVSASEWATDIYVTGAYDGPNDIAANKDYRIEWQADGGRLLEKGSVTLVRSSGETIDQTWSSIITPEGRKGVGFDDPIDVAANANALDRLLAYTGRSR